MNGAGDAPHRDLEFTGPLGHAAGIHPVWVSDMNSKSGGRACEDKEFNLNENFSSVRTMRVQAPVASLNLVSVWGDSPSPSATRAEPHLPIAARVQE